jgi:tRNA pseudouridine32 synthase / 23S rRNA pseudouridine746 synthase
MPPDFLHRDDDVVAVNKPEGVASVPEGAADPNCLAAQVSAVLGAKVFPVHRLDKEVSGVILYARHAKAHRWLNMAFERRDVQKTYLALVHGVVAGESGNIDQPMREFGSGRMGVDPAGKPCETAYRVRERLGAFTLLEVQPRTGRRHQIRVHLYHLGHPIVGDLRYGDRALQKTFARLMLHSSGIAIRLPSGQTLSLRVCPSATFDAEMNRLRCEQGGFVGR